MSIKGGDYRWFRQALARGDLPLVKATAAHLPAVKLEDALSVALLVIEQEPRGAGGRRTARKVGERLARWPPRGDGGLVGPRSGA